MLSELLHHGALLKAHSDYMVAGVQLVSRAALGSFFAISGFHKLFNPTRRATMLATLKADGIPFPNVNVWFVAANELCGGLAVASGFLTVPAAVALAVICLVAFCTDGCKRIRGWHPLDVADALDDVLYLPETLYLLFAVLLVLTGAGPLSIDAVIF